MKHSLIIPIIWLAIPATAAHACDCGRSRDRATDVARVLERADNIAKGRVLSARQTRDALCKGCDPLVRARVKIERVIRGTLPIEISVESEGGDNGANCGYGETLIQAKQSGRPLVLAFQQKSKSGRYYISGCGQILGEGDLPN